MTLLHKKLVGRRDTHNASIPKLSKDIGSFPTLGVIVQPWFPVTVTWKLKIIGQKHDHLEI